MSSNFVDYGNATALMGGVADRIEKNYFEGTKEEWEALTDEQKAVYDQRAVHLKNGDNNPIDLSGYQKKNLATPVGSQTTVEGALGALNTYKATTNATNTFTKTNTFGSNVVTEGNLTVQADSSNRRIRLVDKLNAIGTTIASAVWGLVGIEFADKNNERSAFIQPTFNTDGSSNLVLSIDSASNPNGKIKVGNETFDYANSQMKVSDTLTLTNYRSLEILTGADVPLAFYENANEDYKAIAAVYIGSGSDYRNYTKRYQLYCQGGHLKFASWDSNGSKIVDGTII